MNEPCLLGEGCNIDNIWGAGRGHGYSGEGAELIQSVSNLNG